MTAEISFKGPRVLVCVAGSIAAIKAPALIRRLREGGASVEVIASRNALRWISEISLATAAGKSAMTDKTWWDSPTAQHLTAARCEACVVVGATADVLARAAGGHASDLLSATLLSVRAPIFWAPAMNTAMWRHPAVQANVQTLQGWGHVFLGPVAGPLGTVTEGEGEGRMMEPEDIAKAMLRPETDPDLRGLKVLVSAGPTREWLDPVRFISNPSSGKMGFAVAEVAARCGAEVTLVSGPVALQTPAGVRRSAIETALDMHDAMLQHAPEADIVVMTAAVADYRAAVTKNEKVAKMGDEMNVQMVKNPDILAAIGASSGKAGRVLVGFAMETHAGPERAAIKARNKKADFILLNYPAQAEGGFGSDDNAVTIVRPNGEHDAWPLQSKREVALKLLREALRLRVQKMEN